MDGNVVPLGIITVMVVVELGCAAWLLKRARPFLEASQTGVSAGWGDVGKLALPLACLLAALGVQMVALFMLR